MHYVGRAGSLQSAGQFPIAPGLFPVHTEFFHTVRYLDVGPDGAVTMAPRMKEVRYARKAMWMTYDALKEHVALEARDHGHKPAAHARRRLVPRGGHRRTGWAGTSRGSSRREDGSLRPQSLEESAFCEGCHGGIGVTTDGIFSFARKLRGRRAGARVVSLVAARPARASPSRSGGTGSSSTRSTCARRAPATSCARTPRCWRASSTRAGELRPDEVKGLHSDIARLLLPSAARALDLDRAYHAVVVDQSFDHGRDAVLAPSANVQDAPVVGGKTGIERPRGRDAPRALSRSNESGPLPTRGGSVTERCRDFTQKAPQGSSAGELFVAAVSVRRLPMRRLALLTLLSGSAIAASAALLACGNGDDNSAPVPKAPSDASADGTAADGTPDHGGRAHAGAGRRHRRRRAATGRRPPRSSSTCTPS